MDDFLLLRELTSKQLPFLNVLLVPWLQLLRIHQCGHVDADSRWVNGGGREARGLWQLKRLRVEVATSDFKRHLVLAEFLHAIGGIEWDLDLLALWVRTCRNL